MTLPRRKHLIIGGSIYALDAFFMGQGIWATIVALVAILIGLVNLVRAFAGDRSRLPHVVAMMLTYVFAVVLTFVTIVVNNKIADRRAHVVVDAVKLYKERHGDYPATLQDLVPAYLPAVPRAKYTLAFNNFDYMSDKRLDHVSLSYTTLPPFGRPYYNFKTNTWGYLD